MMSSACHSVIILLTVYTCTYMYLFMNELIIVNILDKMLSLALYPPALNILIYTVIAGVFLGVLMLVSIITCWVRSRKNNRLRSLLPQDAPQDYLDYIQQGQFTPLTTSELIASMRERPPTYNESEVIQRRMNDTSHGDTPPPPLPPRNPSPRGSSPEEEQRNEEVNQREPLGNLDTTEGQIDHQAPLIDIDTMLFDSFLYHPEMTSPYPYCYRSQMSHSSHTHLIKQK